MRRERGKNNPMPTQEELIAAWEKVEKQKAYWEARNQTEEYKAYQKAYRQTEKNKAYRKAYDKTGKRKAYLKAYYLRKRAEREGKGNAR